MRGGRRTQRSTTVRMSEHLNSVVARLAPKVLAELSGARYLRRRSWPCRPGRSRNGSIICGLAVWKQDEASSRSLRISAMALRSLKGKSTPFSGSIRGPKWRITPQCSDTTGITHERSTSLTGTEKGRLGRQLIISESCSQSPSKTPLERQLQQPQQLR